MAETATIYHRSYLPSIPPAPQNRIATRHNPTFMYLLLALRSHGLRFGKTGHHGASAGGFLSFFVAFIVKNGHGNSENGSFQYLQSLITCVI